MHEFALVFSTLQQEIINVCSIKIPLHVPPHLSCVATLPDKTNTRYNDLTGVGACLEVVACASLKGGVLVSALSSRPPSLRL